LLINGGRVEEAKLEEENEENIRDDLEETQEEAVEKADEGEMLVLRSVLSGRKGAKDEQRENIFHSRCTVQGKLCYVIIDGGSYANEVSLSMIKKLGLQTMTHPYPCNIQWLNQSKGI